MHLSGGTAQKSILVADDQLMLVSGLTALLQSNGYNIAAACDSGEAALKALADTDPDIVIADLCLHSLSGVKLLKRLREEGIDVPFILYTSQISGADARSAIECGVNGILLKNADQDALLNCIATVERGQNWIDRIIMKAAMEAPNRDMVWPSLSPAERRIARLAAEGMHNSEIAGATCLTEGTVKVHLNRIFRKLGISSRLMLVRDFREGAGRAAAHI
jgi:DNA-binding NarL/FixJ family response regulator